MEKSSKIYVAGHTGLVGSALIRKLKADGYTSLMTLPHDELDLTRQTEVEAYFEKEGPEYVFLAAAKVGGIMANFSFPAEFIYTNLMIQTSVLHSSYLYGVKKLLFLGSSCIYPRECPQPMKEEYLLTGPLEQTNEPYAIAKIAGMKMCQSYNRQYGTKFITAMPTNLYGPNDNFDLQTSHVLPALIRKVHESAKAGLDSVEIWGTGSPRREFLHVDDLADACLFLMNYYDETDIINIGTGVDLSILELAKTIADIVTFEGEIRFDLSKPDGTPVKCLDVSKLTSLGWKAKIPLKEGIKSTLSWYIKNSNYNSVPSKASVP